MKKLATLVVILSLATVACDAFKDSYDQVNTPGVEVGDGSSNAGGAVGDATVCQAVEGVTLTVAEEPGAIVATVLSTAADGSKVSAVAEKVTDTSTKITIKDGDNAAVSFVIMKAGENEFAVCSVVAEGLTLKSGEVTLDSFNLASESDAAKIVNSGSFKFVFAKEEAETEATKIMAAMAADAASEVTMEGTYFTEALAEAAAE